MSEYGVYTQRQLRRKEAYDNMLRWFDCWNWEEIYHWADLEGTTSEEYFNQYVEEFLSL